jgi:predicted dehydrogenase
LRFGAIGTARVVPYGLVQPARSVPNVTVEAVASRSLEKARSFAALHGIQQSFGSYQELLDSKDINAVYIALPTALHAEWVRKALEAGKDVLCEKPLAVTERVAKELVLCSRSHNRVLHEAMHIRYLQRLHRQREIVRGGELGRPIRVESCFRVPRVPMADGDFRLVFELGGGAGLDLGVYAVSCLRFMTGEEPEVTGARCKLAAPDVDRWMRATCRFPSGIEGIAECGFRGWYMPRLGVAVECERGWIKWDKAGLVYKKGTKVVREAVPTDWTYQHQIQSFLRSIRQEPTDMVSPDDSVANARVIDAMYAKAGLRPRDAASAA